MKSGIIKFFNGIMVVLLTVSLSGCMSFSDNKLPKLSKIDHKTQAAVETSVNKDFLYKLSGGKFITSIKQGRNLNDKLFSIWVDNGYIKSFSYVPDEKYTGKADYNLTLYGKQVTKFSITRDIINTYTIGLIPYTIDNNYELNPSLFF